MQTFLLIVSVVLFLVLIFYALLNISNRAIVKKNWPERLSFKTKIEIWYLFSVLGIEFYRVKDTSVYLCDFVHFFLSGLKVPPECGENNPVVLLFDFTVGTIHEKVMSKKFFLNNFSKYLLFESFREYKKYIDTIS